jgi:hypothetical protein
MPVTKSATAPGGRFASCVDRIVRAEKPAASPGPPRRDHVIGSVALGGSFLGKQRAVDSALDLSERNGLSAYSRCGCIRSVALKYFLA